MTSYIDPFGRDTIVQVVHHGHSNQICIFIRKDRQTICESWSASTTRSILKDLTSALKTAEEFEVHETGDTSPTGPLSIYSTGSPTR